MKTYRTTLLSATFLMGFGAAPLHAQDAESQAAAETAADASTGNNDEIIVTGTRRAISVQDVPINITAIGTEQLDRQRIDDIRDIADFTPGVTISDTGPGSTGTIVLRGLNASDSDTGGAGYDNALGVYLGEVPIYYDFKMLDIARVEVLLGPQGTLYGLGTLAGAIRNIPNRPNVTTLEGGAHGRLYAKAHGSQIGYVVDGMFNIPIVKDHIAFRTATGYFYDPGFINSPLLLQESGVSLPQPTGPDSVTPDAYAANLFTRKDVNFEQTFTTRNQLLFQVNDGLKLDLTYAYQRTKTDGGQYNSNGVLGTGRYENGARYIEPVDRHAHLFSAELDANIADIADLVATTAYTIVETDNQSDNTDLLLDLDYDYEAFPAFSSFNESQSKRKQFNQEVRLVSTHGGPFSWVIGGFYNEQKLQRDYREHLPNHPAIQFGTLPNPDEIEYASYTTSKVTEKAIFGETTFHVTPEFQLTGGARYFKYTSNILGRAVVPPLGDPVSPYDLEAAGGSSGKSGWVWKLNSSYNITPDLLVYATYSKGYRIGGPNAVAPCILPLDPDVQNVCALENELQYGPDTTKNAEIGARAQLFDNRLSLNFNVFQIKWDGIQLGSATINGIVGITVNGGKAKSEGFETSFQLKPVDGLSIQGTYSYVDAKLSQDVPAIIAINDPAGTYPSDPIQLDGLKGDRLPGSAKNSGSLGVTYEYPVKYGNVVANWTSTYRGNVVTRLGYDRAYGDKLPGYVLHRASLNYETDNYSFGIFANNIFDKYAIASVSNDRSRVGLNDGVLLRYYRRTVINPRTFGFEFRVKY